MGYYAAAGDPGFFDWIGSAASSVGKAVVGLGRSLGFTGPAQVVQRWQETGNAIGSFASVAKERGWGGAALDVAKGLGLAATGGLFGAAGATAAQIGMGLFSSSEPPYGGPAYDDVMTAQQPPQATRGYSTHAWDLEEQDEPDEDYYEGIPEYESVASYGRPPVTSYGYSGATSTQRAFGGGGQRIVGGGWGEYQRAVKYLP